MIEQIHILNLKRREDKWQVALGALLALEFPYERLNRFIAHDGLDYDDIDAIVRAAEADGFDLSCKYRDCIDTGKADGYERQIMATAWSYCSILRYISEQNNLHLWLLDEFLPAYNWHGTRFIAWSKEVMRIHGWRRLIVQLARSYRSDEPRLRADYSEAEWRDNLGSGFRSAQDGAFLLNATGAGFLLERFIKHSQCFVATTRILLREKPNGLFHAIEPIITNFVSSPLRWKSDRHLTNKN